MSSIAETIGAGGSKLFNATGDFIRLMGAAGRVEIVFYRGGAEICRSGVVGAGYAETFRKGGFESFAVFDKSGAENDIEIVYRMDSDVRYDTPPTGVVRVVGSVNTTNKKAFSQSEKIVGNAEMQVCAANADRDYLLIQNTHESNVLYLTVSGDAATVNNGIRIGPGGSFELSSTVPTLEVRAIASAAGTTVIVVEA